MLVGIDEVGRGCWAGPVVAGAVMLHTDIPSLNDSKQLSATQRDKLSHLVLSSAVCSLGWATAQEVDSHGLTQAVRLAMIRAIDGIPRVKYSRIIIDGSYNFLEDHSPGISQAIVRADGDVPEVSAASIIAKVARDDYMKKQASLYPQYGFESHVGYGTARHSAALQQHSVCPLHRLSYKPIQRVLSAVR